METQDDIETLVRRLIENPHDQVAITQAHRSGQNDPRVYAALLERVGKETPEPSLASHWYTEAANVWVASLGDAHQAARALMHAIERDPTDAVPAERLAGLYREKRDSKALVALLERRARALASLVRTDPVLRATVVGIHEELGRLWAEPPLGNPSKALDNYGKAIEYDPKSQFSIYATRELLKAAGRYGEAIPYFEMERMLSPDPTRRLALYLDEADVCKAAGEEELAAGALRQAVVLDPGDASLRQQLGTIVLELVRAGRQVDLNLRHEAAEMFVLLAEEFAEHALAYSLCALEMLPTHDRAMQLALHYGKQLGSLNEVATFAAAYVRSNPAGPFVDEARSVAGDSVAGDAEPRGLPGPERDRAFDSVPDQGRGGDDALRPRPAPRAEVGPPRAARPPAPALGGVAGPGLQARRAALQRAAMALPPMGSVRVIPLGSARSRAAIPRRSRRTGRLTKKRRRSRRCLRQLRALPRSQLPRT